MDRICELFRGQWVRFDRHGVREVEAGTTWALPWSLSRKRTTHSNGVVDGSLGEGELRKGRGQIRDMHRFKVSGARRPSCPRLGAGGRSGHCHPRGTAVAN